MLTLFPSQFYIPEKIVDEICWTEGTYCVSSEQSRPFSPFAPNVRTAPAAMSLPACSTDCTPWLPAPSRLCNPAISSARLENRSPSFSPRRLRLQCAAPLTPPSCPVDRPSPPLACLLSAQCSARARILSLSTAVTSALPLHSICSEKNSKNEPP